MRQHGHRATAVVGALILVATLGACSGSGRSEAAYCGVFRKEATKLHDKYQGAADTSEADPFGSLLTVVQAPGDLVRMFDKLAKVAPDDIQTEVEAVRDSMAEMQDDAGGAVTDPLGGLGSLLVNGLSNAGAWQAVQEYTTEHCGLPPYD